MPRTQPSGRLLLAAAMLVLAAAVPALAADPNAPAELVVTTTVARPAEKVPPLGPNNWGGVGAVEWAANNFVRNAGNEPIYWRNLHRVARCGPGWFEIDGPGTSWWDLWNSGFLSGATLRIYRLVDKDGKVLPSRADGKNLELAAADHAIFVGKGQVIPEGAKDFPDGGWIANTYVSPTPNAWIRHGNLSVTDALAIEVGKTYWYAVVAVSADDQESDLSNEVSITPRVVADDGPHVVVAGNDDKVPPLLPGAKFEFTPKVFGGAAPYRWEVEGELPKGLTLDAATGKLSGSTTEVIEAATVRLKVTDAKGRGATRQYVLGTGEPPKSKAKAAADAKAPKGPKPAPPEDLKVVAGKDCVTLTWKPSPTPNVLYRLKRSSATKAKQMQRVFVTADTPELEPWDYIVLERRLVNFDMKYANPRIRGIGNPPDAPAWYWHGDPSKLKFSLVPHPKPVPAEMVDPGETCLEVKAGPGEQTISQIVLIGTRKGGESLWYGQLEPGKKYRLEAWLRQEGLGESGAVTFSYGKGYPEIRQAFQVAGEWKKYTYDFTGPERPADTWHFGHQFAFTGPGTLWMDNARIFRVDRPEDADKPYVPNATVLEEMLKSQPESGRKGTHRIWFLSRDATMASILSWHAGSEVRPDWRTGVDGTMQMTVPMGLAFDLATGPDPKSRMRPWLVLQHILHSEADWQALIEYLAAPYDPKTDTPESKPWAYKRTQQRGTGAPWTDEFETITIEFGNETWHNGHFDDWLGFSTRGAIHQGGREYGLFMTYLIDNITKSPYWKSRKLDGKIRFALGANYDCRIEKDGTVRGYGEEAMQACPGATYLGHANYVGPKWETGDYSARQYDDHGIQECLLSFLRDPEPGQIRMGKAREMLAKSHHEYDIAAYEGGPGGFALPGTASPQQVETNEKYGKSLAQAVGALDAWMRSYLYGWTDQCYLVYGQGRLWASHTVFSEGFRPSAAWLALAMRNRYASGDLMVVEERSVPTLQHKKETYPLVGAYAMRDKDRWSVFVVSRKLDGNHDGADFGDGSTPVKLVLPFQKAGKITLHKLAGDPRLTNNDKMSIAIQSQGVPASALQAGAFAVTEQTGGVKGGMPAGSIFLYVFEAAP